MNEAVLNTTVIVTIGTPWLFLITQLWGLLPELQLLKARVELGASDNKHMQQEWAGGAFQQQTCQPHLNLFLLTRKGLSLSATYLNYHALLLQWNNDAQHTAAPAEKQQLYIWPLVLLSKHRHTPISFSCPNLPHNWIIFIMLHIILVLTGMFVKHN